MGGHQVGRWEDRLHGGNPPDLGQVGGDGRGGELTGLTTAERERLREMEKENREFRRANEILNLE